MLVQTAANGDLTIKAAEETSYALRQIPGAIRSAQLKGSPTTPVVIELIVNGKYEQTGHPKRTAEELRKHPLSLHSPECQETVTEIRKRLRPHSVTFSGVKELRSGRVRAFYLKLPITCQYELGECSGEDIVGDINHQLQQLEEVGFITSTQLSQEELEESD